MRSRAMRSSGITLIRCHGPTNGRRKCSNLEDLLPQKYLVVLRAMTEVLKHHEPSVPRR